MALRPVKPIIVNHAFVGVNTEETIVLPENVMDFAIRLRNTAHSVKLAVISGQSGTNYITLDSAVPILNGDDLLLFGCTLYAQSPDAGAVLEIILYR